MSFKNILKKTWDFIWHENSLASWLVNVILAFVIVKFLIYPGLGLVLGTGYPVVAVVSNSMEHATNFEDWWENNKDFYLVKNITKENFSEYHFKNGFNKGDIMVLIWRKPVNIKIGDVIVFKGSLKDPIIHRVVRIYMEDDNYYVQTKGDNNSDSRQDELKIPISSIVGKAVFRIPFLGWVKIFAFDLINMFIGR
ncbi:MAG: signal peptidase I [Nanoarchaeota archaeon]|nr:signal peptidase I [Nanoarchaeota archaeon]MBU0962895.1 signal peptidase I [Nanoarchaeota archaeon]